MGLVFILAFTFFSLVGFALIVSGDSVWCFVVDLLAVYFAVAGVIYFMIVVVFLCLVTNFWFWIWLRAVLWCDCCGAVLVCGFTPIFVFGYVGWRFSGFGLIWRLPASFWFVLLYWLFGDLHWCGLWCFAVVLMVVGLAVRISVYGGCFAWVYCGLWLLDWILVC